jgi:hypothetical protein
MWRHTLKKSDVEFFNTIGQKPSFQRARKSCFGGLGIERFQVENLSTTIARHGQELPLNAGSFPELGAQLLIVTNTLT